MEPSPFNVWVELAKIIVPTMGTVATAYLVLVVQRGNKASAERAQAASVEVNQVKDTLKETTVETSGKLDAIGVTTQKTLAYVNSAMGRALHTNMLSTQAASDANQGDVALRHVASEAKRLYEEHLRADEEAKTVDSALRSAATATVAAAAAATAAAHAEEPPAKEPPAK